MRTHHSRQLQIAISHLVPYPHCYLLISPAFHVCIESLTSFNILTFPNNPSKRSSFCVSTSCAAAVYPLPLLFMPPPNGDSEYWDMAEAGRGDAREEDGPDGGKRIGEGEGLCVGRRCLTVRIHRSHAPILPSRQHLDPPCAHVGRCSGL